MMHNTNNELKSVFVNERKSVQNKRNEQQYYAYWQFTFRRKSRALKLHFDSANDVDELSATVFARENIK